MDFDFRKARDLADLTQVQAARRAGIERTRLSLAECNDLELSEKEKVALRRVLLKALESRAVAIQDVLAEIGAHPAEEANAEGCA